MIFLVNSLTSLYGGLSVFCVLGFMAKRSNTELSKVVRSGITLAFVSFPAAIAEMPGAVAWSCIFFFMVLLLGLDTQFTVVEICSTAIMDYFPGVSSNQESNKKINPLFRKSNQEEISNFSQQVYASYFSFWDYH